jgi:DNA-binding PadR family transcriptional regulator
MGHPEHVHEDNTRQARRWSRRKGGHMGHRHEHFAAHSRGGHGGGRHRARRGAAVEAALMLLDERPMHGYELISEMSERSGGRWEPSPGTIYPALNRMEERGLIEAEEVDGRRRFTLTPDGRARVVELRDAQADGASPWDDPGTGRRGDLRGRVAELVGQVRQIGKFGTPEQAEAAAKVLDGATRQLYAILATAPAEPSPDEGAAAAAAAED